MEILGFIPARGGSKGIPGKNVYPLNGKPLITYTIEEAKKSRITRLFVSTDSKEIADVSQAAGVSVPFLRSSALAEDHSIISDVILDALDQLQSRDKYIPDVIVLLQPTSPLRKAQYIDESIELFLKNDVDSVISVSEPMEHPSLTVFWNGPTEMKLALGEKYKILPRQAYPNYYTINGMIYVFSPKTIRKYKNVFGEKVLPYKTGKSESIDIDTIEELRVLEAILEYRERHSTKEEGK